MLNATIMTPKKYAILLYINFIALFFILPNNLSAQAKTADLITGSWVLDIAKSIDLMDSDEQRKFHSLSVDTQRKIKASLVQRKVFFGRDGSYMIKMRKGKRVSGTWELQADDFLFIEFTSGQQFTQKVVSVDSRNFVLDIDVGNAGRLIRKWHLVKSR